MPEYKHDKSEIAILRKTATRAFEAAIVLPLLHFANRECVSFLFVIFRMGLVAERQDGFEKWTDLFGICPDTAWASLPWMASARTVVAYAIDGTV